MRNVPNWFDYCMGIAYAVAKRSKDPVVQVGCVITDNKFDTISTGYNGFEAGKKETPAMWSDEQKQYHVLHAERNAIENAKKRGLHVENCYLFTTRFPCNHCAVKIKNSGISLVVSNDIVIPKYEERVRWVKEYFDKHHICWEHTQIYI